MVLDKYKSDTASALFKELDNLLGYSALLNSSGAITTGAFLIKNSSNYNRMVETTVKGKNTLITLLKAKQTQTALLFECFLGS